MKTIISVDVEADGPIPCQNSLRSIGAVAYDLEGTEQAAFTINLEPLEGAKPDPPTLSWWQNKHPQAWVTATRDPRRPDQAIQSFAQWLLGFPEPVLLAAPVAFDMCFLRWYLVKFVGEHEIWLHAIDLRSVATAVLGRFPSRYKDAIRKFNPDWPIRGGHSHVALDDAREQGDLFFALWLKGCNLSRELAEAVCRVGDYFEEEPIEMPTKEEWEAIVEKARVILRPKEGGSPCMPSTPS